MENKTMMIDFYELTMGQTYFDMGEKDKKVYFDIFYRNNPFKGGYAISCGLENIINYVKNLKFTDEDIEYLKSYNVFSDEYLNYLKNIKFNGDIFAVEDGTPIFPNEPIITVRANVIEAQILETALLACFNHGTLVTTAAKRITTAAGSRSVMEFGARRARGIDSAIEASILSFIGGCSGTSNVYAAKKTGIPGLGTFAHSIVCDGDDELEVFKNYAKSNPKSCMFLVDTYNTLKSGVPNAIRVADEYLTPNNIPFIGIRIDSGDLAILSRESRKMLDEAGYKDSKICISNGLDERKILQLIKDGACFDTIGLGDNLSASKERMNGVYKLVAVEDDKIIIPRIKISDDKEKTINPGYKKVYRLFDKETGIAMGDVVALNDEVLAKDKITLVNQKNSNKKKTVDNYITKELQKQIFKNGELVYDLPSIFERRDYCSEQFKTLDESVKPLDNYSEYMVSLSDNLSNLKNNMVNENIKKCNKVYRKVR